MTDLNRLADLVRGCDMLDADRDYLTTLLRSAAAETVGTEWDHADTMSAPYPQRACVRHNADLSACRLALVAARKERDEKQRAIDKAFGVLRSMPHVRSARDAAENIPRPHATPSQPERQWSSTPPSDRSGKWWNAFGFECSDQCLHLVPNTMTWDQAENGDDWGYDLWLPYVEGDTRDSLPPLPNSSATVTSSPAPASRPCDCRELVARLAECVRNIQPLDEALPEIIRDARGGGA